MLIGPGAGVGLFFPKRLVNGFFGLALGAGVGVAPAAGEVPFFARDFVVVSGEAVETGLGLATAPGEGLFLARVFLGEASGLALVCGLAAGEGLAPSVFLARCFGLADGVGVCE